MMDQNSNKEKEKEKEEGDKVVETGVDKDKHEDYGDVFDVCNYRNDRDLHAASLADPRLMRIEYLKVDADKRVRYDSTGSYYSVSSVESNRPYKRSRTQAELDEWQTNYAVEEFVDIHRMLIKNNLEGCIDVIKDLINKRKHKKLMDMNAALTKVEQHVKKVYESTEACLETIKYGNLDNTKSYVNVKTQTDLESGSLNLGMFRDVATSTDVDEQEFTVVSRKPARDKGKAKAKPKSMTSTRGDKPVTNQSEAKTPKPSAKVAPRSYALVVKSTSSVDSDGVKQAVKLAIDPTKSGIRVRSVKKMKEKGVIVVTHNEADLLKLKNELDSAEGLSAQEPSKLKPRILFHNVSRDLEPQGIISSLRAQNEDRLNIADENDALDLALKFRTGKRRDDTCDWVAEVSPELRKSLLRLKNVYIGWNRCGISDFLVVTRCFRCQRIGHVKKYCKNNITCNHCAEEGHLFKDCPSKAKKEQCTLCRRAGTSAEHAQKHCPLYKRAVEALRAKIDYEGSKPKERVHQSNTCILTSASADSEASTEHPAVNGSAPMEET